MVSTQKFQIQDSHRRNEAPPRGVTRIHRLAVSGKSSADNPATLKFIEKSPEALRKKRPSGGVPLVSSRTPETSIAIPSQIKCSINPVPLLTHCMMTGIAESEDELMFSSLAGAYGFKQAVELATAMNLRCERTLNTLRNLLIKYGKRRYRIRAVTLIKP